VIENVVQQLMLNDQEAGVDMVATLASKPEMVDAVVQVDTIGDISTL
jgi:hypothetical protein